MCVFFCNAVCPILMCAHTNKKEKKPKQQQIKKKTQIPNLSMRNKATKPQIPANTQALNETFHSVTYSRNVCFDAAFNAIATFFCFCFRLCFVFLFLFLFFFLSCCHNTHKQKKTIAKALLTTLAMVDRNKAVQFSTYALVFFFFFFFLSVCVFLC